MYLLAQSRNESQPTGAIKREHSQMFTELERIRGPFLAEKPQKHRENRGVTEFAEFCDPPCFLCYFLRLSALNRPFQFGLMRVTRGISRHLRRGKIAFEVVLNQPDNRCPFHARLFLLVAEFTKF